MFIARRIVTKARTRSASVGRNTQDPPIAGLPPLSPRIPRGTTPSADVLFSFQVTPFLRGTVHPLENAAGATLDPVSVPAASLPLFSVGFATATRLSNSWIWLSRFVMAPIPLEEHRVSLSRNGGYIGDEVRLLLHFDGGSDSTSGTHANVLPGRRDRFTQFVLCFGAGLGWPLSALSLFFYLFLCSKVS